MRTICSPGQVKDMSSSGATGIVSSIRKAAGRVFRIRGHMDAAIFFSHNIL